MTSKKKLSVSATKSFARNLKHLARKKHGIEKVVFSVADELSIKPDTGLIIPGTKDILRKLRLPDPASGKGKRGGFRLIYAWRNDFDAVYLCFMYSKSDKADISSKELEIALEELESVISEDDS